MFAELVPINRTRKTEEKTLSFALENEFTDEHQIKLVWVNKQRQLAIFVTESHHPNNNSDYKSPIDSVTVLKMVVGAGDNLSYKQVTLALPEKQVNTKVMCIHSEKEDTIYLFCLY